MVASQAILDLKTPQLSSGTSLGRNLSDRVLYAPGNHPRTELLEAVVWYCDMRSYTRLGHEISPVELIALLNSYIDCVGPAILDHGGEIVKFLGDAVLATFPCGRGGAGAACHRATQAALAARQRLKILNLDRRRQGREEIAFDLGLTLGKVAYGVIGFLSQFDITVVGLPVNLAGRLEELCERLQESVLVSKTFAAESGLPLRHVGVFELKGFDLPQAVFGL